MTLRLLVAIAIAQVVLLLALLLLLTGRRLLHTHGEHRRERQRGKIVEHLCRVHDGGVDAEELRAVLSGFDRDLTVELMLALVAQIDGDARELLVSVLRSPEWLAHIRRQARSSRWWRRVTAARALAAVGTSEDLPVLRPLVDDSEPTVRLAALPALRTVADRELVAAALEQALAAGAVLRSFILDILSVHGEIVVPLLVDEWNRGNRDGDSSLLACVAYLDDPRLLGALLAAADSPSVEARELAAQALGRYPHPRTSAVLARLLGDADARVRAAAAASLGRIRAVEARSSLVEALHDPSGAVRLLAGIALRRIGPSGLEILRGLSTSQDRGVVGLARYVLSLDELAVAEHGVVATGAEVQ